LNPSQPIALGLSRSLVSLRDGPKFKSEIETKIIMQLLPRIDSMGCFHHSQYTNRMTLILPGMDLFSASKEAGTKSTDNQKDNQQTFWKPKTP
jgi:hypothetical protein